MNPEEEKDLDYQVGLLWKVFEMEAELEEDQL